MNSEELEVSLRAEFESYLKDVFAEMRQEISQFQEKFDAELERHKSELDDVFSNVLSKVESTRELDAGFKETVVEHLRLAKDEGARITATAIAQAEELEKESAPSVGIKEIHEAIADISSKQSQAEILKSLVQHAGQFATRGAFFIIKNEHLVGWRVFGSENFSTDEKLREVFLPLSSESVLSESVKSLKTIKNPSTSYTDDAELFNRLEFKDSSQKVAVPLIARGRGVAVLYADGGDEHREVNTEALETLVRVAGLTVEVLASAKSTAVKKDFTRREEPQTVEESAPAVAYVAEENYDPAPSQPDETPEWNYSEQEQEIPQTEVSQPTEAENSDAPTVEEPQPFYVQEPSIAPSVAEAEPVEGLEKGYLAEQDREISENEAFVDEPESESYEIVEPETAQKSEDTVYESNFREEENFEQTSTDWSQTETAPQNYSAQEYAENFAKETDPSEYAKDFSYQSNYDTAELEESKDFAYQPSVENENSYTENVNAETAGNYEFEPTKVESFETYQSPQTEAFAVTSESFTPTTEAQTYNSFDQQTQPAEENSYSFEPVVAPPVSAPPPKSRLSERNVDLPIEVSEDERRLHNDARRFARLLVSEIKLYNEQKVKEGRDSGDLYDRLREAIDRSREMYDKRVQPLVAAKFDYFHYEIVNTLAEGNADKLGTGYPGSNVQ